MRLRIPCTRGDIEFLVHRMLRGCQVTMTMTVMMMLKSNFLVEAVKPSIFLCLIPPLPPSARQGQHRPTHRAQSRFKW
jgi:hypothetical protein